MLNSELSESVEYFSVTFHLNSSTNCKAYINVLVVMHYSL